MVRIISVEDIDLDGSGWNNQQLDSILFDGSISVKSHTIQAGEHKRARHDRRLTSAQSKRIQEEARRHRDAKPIICRPLAG